MIENLKKFVAPINRKISMLIARAVITAVQDSKKIQELQIEALAGEVLDDNERFQNYGMSSAPLPGAEAVVIFPNGDRDHGLVIAVDDRRYRIKNLAPGEVVIYTDEGDKIHLKRGNKIEITTKELIINATTKVEVNAPTTDINSATVNVTADNATITATAKAVINSPDVEITAATMVKMTTAMLDVSGLIKCSGIASGGATPEAGKAKITGDLETTGDIKDGNGSMDEMRSTYNSHNHVASGPTPIQQM